MNQSVGAPGLRLLVVEDHPIVVAGCRALFMGDEDVELFTASSCEEGRQLFAAHKPDVTVVDINLPDGSGLEFVRAGLAMSSDAKFVVFTMSDAPIIAMEALEIGAQGYVSKNGNPDHLREAVFAVRDGKRWLPTDLLQDIALLRSGVAGKIPKLSARQMQILRALAQGHTMSEIAHNIDVCYKTVASNCAELRRKLNARTSSELVRIAVQLRIV